MKKSIFSHSGFSLQIKMFLLICALMICSMGVLSTFLLNNLRNIMVDEFKEKGMLLSRNFSENVAEAVLVADTEMMDRSLEALIRSKDIAYVYIFGDSGMKYSQCILIGTDGIDIIEHPYVSKAEMNQLTVGKAKVPVIEFCTPVMHEGQKIGLIQLGISLSRVDSQVKERIFYLTLLVIVIMLISSFLSFVFSRTLTKPIQTLLKSVKRIGVGDLSHAVEVQSKDEIGELAEAFNMMTENLKNTMVSVDVLQLEKQRFNDIVETSGDWIWEIDSQGTFLYVSSVVEEVLGYRPEELLKKNFNSLFVCVQEDKRDKDLFDQFFKGEKFRNVECLLRAKDDTDIFVETAAVPIRDNEGVLLGYRGVCHDISERKNAEKVLRDAKELAEQANVIKSKFLSNVSHEIRTPLHCIIGFAEKIVKEKDPDCAGEDASIILREADTLLALINDLLDNSKIESGNIELEKAPIDLYQLLSGIKQSIGIHANEKGLTFKLKIEDAVPTIVIADGLRLRQILVNLAMNAIKFTKKGFVVLVVRLERKQTKNVYINFSILDTGIGIPKEKQKYVFESFCQLDSSLTRKFRGTGLGMTIAKQLVDLMGGELKLESEVGEGTKVFFTIPLTIADNIQPSDKSAITEHGISEELKVDVLLAEDYLTSRMIAKIHFESFGSNITIVEDGKQALEMARENKYDVIYLDLQMPVMDGLEASSKIREYNKDVILVALTANVDHEIKQECFKNGFNDLLAKPLRRKTLYLNLKRWTT